MSPAPRIEICVEGVDEAVTAEAAGADRVELCAGMTDGGLTPSAGTVAAALARLGRARVMAMVRPRAGDFLYSEAEFASMLDDVARFRTMGVPGIVAGCLTAEGEIDRTRMRKIVEAAGDMEVTCHRAFDMTRDPAAALEALIDCGVDRVLTSGQAARAEDGLGLLRALVRQGAGRITVMICGALTPAQVAAEGSLPVPHDIHFAQVERVDGPMRYRNRAVTMGDGAEEYGRRHVDPDALAATIAACRGTGGGKA